jgi:hypothetical protein
MLLVVGPHEPEPEPIVLGGKRHSTQSVSRRTRIHRDGERGDIVPLEATV